MPRLTLYGFYQYDKTLFDGILLPDGIDSKTLVDSIMMYSGDLYPYYQALDMLKFNIRNWFSHRLLDFDRMHKALRAEYSPIENYDRTEEIKREYQNSGTDSVKTTLGSTTTSEKSGSDTTQMQVSAYDEEAYTNRDKETVDFGNRVINTGSGSDTTETMHGLKRVEEEKTRVHGNIGVTTAQQMITEEMRMRMQYDIYRVIAMLFEREFLVQVY